MQAHKKVRRKRLAVPGPASRRLAKPISANQVVEYEISVSQALLAQQMHKGKAGWWKKPHNPRKCSICKELRQLLT